MFRVVFWDILPRKMIVDRRLRGAYCLHHQAVRVRAVPWLRWLVAGLSPRRPGFALGSIHVGFVADKVALVQVFLRVLRLSPVNIIPPSLSKLISSGECVICSRKADIHYWV
jgi:hypothetical protein